MKFLLHERPSQAGHRRSHVSRHENERQEDDDNQRENYAGHACRYLNGYCPGRQGFPVVLDFLPVASANQIKPACEHVYLRLSGK